MKYYIDTEFDGFGGELISLALVPAFQKAPEFYIAANDIVPKEQWVRENVMPIVTSQRAVPLLTKRANFSGYIAQYLHSQNSAHDLIHIISDWPDDIRYLMACLITGPGQMINIPRMTTEFVRCETYPTDLPGAIQHNALWDARVLRHTLK